MGVGGGGRMDEGLRGGMEERDQRESSFQKAAGHGALAGGGPLRKGCSCHRTAERKTSKHASHPFGRVCAYLDLFPDRNPSRFASFFYLLESRTLFFTPIAQLFITNLPVGFLEKIYAFGRIKPSD